MHSSHTLIIPSKLTAHKTFLTVNWCVASYKHTRCEGGLGIRSTNTFMSLFSNPLQSWHLLTLGIGRVVMMANKTSLQSLQVNVPSQCCCCCFNTTPKYRQCTAKTLSICCQNIVNELWKRGQHSIKTSSISCENVVSIPSKHREHTAKEFPRTPRVWVCRQTSPTYRYNIVLVRPKHCYGAAKTSST